MIDRFIELIIAEINKLYLCYYEEAPSDTSFPYLIMPSLTVTPLNNGYSVIFDLEVYINELSNESIEEIMDNLRDYFESFSYHGRDISYHVGYENQTIVKSNEQDLSIRRITFSARIFR